MLRGSLRNSVATGMRTVRTARPSARVSDRCYSGRHCDSSKFWMKAGGRQLQAFYREQGEISKDPMTTRLNIYVYKRVSGKIRKEQVCIMEGQASGYAGS